MLLEGLRGRLEHTVCKVGCLEIDAEITAAKKFLEKFTWTNPDNLWEEFEAGTQRSWDVAYYASFLYLVVQECWSAVRVRIF